MPLWDGNELKKVRFVLYAGVGGRWVVVGDIPRAMERPPGTWCSLLPVRNEYTAC